MGRERIDLKQVCQRYKIRVIRMKQKEDHYLLETNRGTKELRVWPRVDVLKWSFAWREHLARQGFRDVERFIRTRDAKPYVVLARRGFTLTDHSKPVEALPATPADAAYCGSLIAHMHQAQQTHPIFAAEDVLKREHQLMGETIRRARERMAAFRRAARNGSREDRFVASQFASLCERMERSEELVGATSPDEEWLTVSHRSLSIDNWSESEGRLFLRGFYQPELSIQHRDTASYLRDLYLKTGDLERVEAFLDGYEQVRPLEYSEYRLLLGFMAFPEDVWEEVESYLEASPEAREEDGITEIETALLQQERVDSLLAHLANRAEQSRSGGHDESI